jgi:hypothetical protein
MIDEKKLRARILSTLNIGLLAAVFDVSACGGSVEPGGGKAQLNQIACQNGPADVQCFPPHSTHFNVGNLPPGTPVSTPEPMFDQNGCQIADQVRDGCCNAPVGGPEFENGQCCYAFCAGACCGRPLMVEGAPRVAPIVRRSDWPSPALDRRLLCDLDAASRRKVADEWLADARMEHASIASFARFTMDLLAFGAPPELVEDAQRAGIDEVAHTRACFAVASLYAEAAYGPGPLNLSGVAPSGTLTEAARAAFYEGCIGETTAALLAGERAHATDDPKLRAVYERIAEDESRHAELAFRFVAWAIAEGGVEVRDAIASALGALRVPTKLAPASGDRMLHAQGRLAEGEIRDVERRALSEVILPCSGALVASPATANSERPVAGSEHPTLS